MLITSVLKIVSSFFIRITKLISDVDHFSVEYRQFSFIRITKLISDVDHFSVENRQFFFYQNNKTYKRC